MDKASIRWTDQDGEHRAEIGLLDWVAWEKHTGKSAGKGIEQITDVLYLTWSAAKRSGDKRPFEAFVDALEGFPTIESDDAEGPTQPGA